MPMPQYNGPVYAQGPTAVGPYNLQGYQPTFGGAVASGNGSCCAPATCAGLQAGFNNQNAYLVAQLKTPAPVPAYTVPNPNGYYGCQQNGYQSCGC